MTPKRSIVLVLLLALMLTVLACASRAAPGADRRTPATSRLANVTVTVLGLRSGDGEVALALFDSRENFEARANPVVAGRIRPTDGTVFWRVENLQPGTYALAVYQDLNGNRALDRTTLGSPAEPYGFSNDARGAFGPPQFDEAAVEIGAAELAIEITLR